VNYSAIPYIKTMDIKDNEIMKTTWKLYSGLTITKLENKRDAFL